VFKLFQRLPGEREDCLFGLPHIKQLLTHKIW